MNRVLSPIQAALFVVEVRHCVLHQLPRLCNIFGRFFKIRPVTRTVLTLRSSCAGMPGPGFT